MQPGPASASRSQLSDLPARVTADSGLQFTLPATWSEAAQHGATLSNLSKWLSSEPAKMAGLSSKGSIAVGKDADLALFSAHPLDMYSLNTHTWIDGQLVFDRSKEGTPDARP